MVRKFNRFKRFSACFKCGKCGKLTRDVNGCNGALGLCELCYEVCGAENHLSDNSKHPDAFGGVFDDCKTKAEVDKRLEALMAEYGYPKN